MTLSLREKYQFISRADLFVPVHEILVLIAHASSEGSDENVQMHSLVRAFTARSHKVGTHRNARVSI